MPFRAPPSCASPAMPSCCRPRARATTCSTTSGTEAACSARRSLRSVRSASMYDGAMRLILACGVLAACGGKPAPEPPKPPNTDLIVGKYERHPPDGTTAAWFRADGSVTIAHEKAELDTKPLAKGSWKLDGDQLTL